LNFLQAVKIYKASPEEKPIPLHTQHHEQTLAGLDYFKAEKNQENVQSFSKKSLSPAENKAVTNINSVVKIAPTPQKKEALLKVIELIKKGTFSSKGLPKSINDFFTANTSAIKNPVKLVEQLFIEVLDRFDLTQTSEDTKKNKKQAIGIINPQIVLTQSFS